MQTNNKLREALSEISNLADALDIDNPNVVAILDQCRDALAEPERNCDVGTAEEQAERFYAFCGYHRFQSGIKGMCSSLCPCIRCRDMCHCITKWAQLPYEEGGAK